MAVSGGDVWPFHTIFGVWLRNGRACSTQSERSPRHRHRARPRVTAIIFWLKNRQPAQWRDVAEIGPDSSPAHRAGILQDIRRDAIVGLLPAPLKPEAEPADGECRGCWAASDGDATPCFIAGVASWLSRWVNKGRQVLDLHASLLRCLTGRRCWRRLHFDARE
jgi:hypothetical protein